MTDPHKIGLALAALLGGWKAVQPMLISADWNQRVIDFAFWAQLVDPTYNSSQFNPFVGLTLVAVNALGGYFLGYLGTLVWNKLHLGLAT